MTLAVRGELDANDMLFREGSARWVRAGTLQSLFATNPGAGIATTAVTPPAVRLPDGLSTTITVAEQEGGSTKPSLTADAACPDRAEVGDPRPAEPTTVEPNRWSSNDTNVDADVASNESVSERPKCLGEATITALPVSFVGVVAESMLSPQLPSMPTLESTSTGTGERSSWLLVTIGVINVLVLVSVVGAVGYYLLAWNTPYEAPQTFHGESRRTLKNIATAGSPKTPAPKVVAQKVVAQKEPHILAAVTHAPTVPASVDWAKEFMESLNDYRTRVGLGSVTLSTEWCKAAAAHAKYLATNLNMDARDRMNVYNEDPNRAGFSSEGQQAGKSALIARAEPAAALNRWLGRLFSRVPLLNPDLHTIGLGYAQNAQGDWISVLDATHGCVEPVTVDSYPDPRALLYPTDKQAHVPCVGFDRIDAGDNECGFPISVMYAKHTRLRNVRAVLNDQTGAEVPVRVSSPENPLNEKLQRTTIGLHPLRSLQPGHTYTVMVSALVNDIESRQTWQFTTAQR